MIYALLWILCGIIGTIIQKMDIDEYLKGFEGEIILTGRENFYRATGWFVIIMITSILGPLWLFVVVGCKFTGDDDEC